MLNHHLFQIVDKTRYQIIINQSSIIEKQVIMSTKAIHVSLCACVVACVRVCVCVRARVRA